MKGESGIYPNIKSAIRHGLISTAKIVAGVDAHPVPMSYFKQVYSSYVVKREST
jgi:hypothetical protein